MSTWSIHFTMKLFKNSQIAYELIKSSNLPAGKGRLVAFFLVNSAAIHLPLPAGKLKKEARVE